MDPKSIFDRMTDHATDPIFQHLRTNHFPIILAMVGVVAALLACVIRKDAIWKYAKVTMLLAAVTAPLAYWTGERAGDKAGGFETWIDHGAMQDHEETAEVALICLLVCGGAAGVALVKPTTLTRAIFVAAAVAAAGATTYTAAIAGNIIHGEEVEAHK